MVKVEKRIKIHVDRIIKPSEIYSKEISESLLKSSRKVVELVETVLRRIDC